MAIKVMEMKRILNMRPDISKIFIGPPGIGKTQIIEQWAKEIGRSCYVLPLSHFDLDDIKGVPYIKQKGDDEVLTIKRGPLIPKPDEEAVLFLDELTTVGKQGLAIALKILDEKRVGYFHFPKTYVVAAGNPPEWEGFELDCRVVRRVTWFEVVPDPDSFGLEMYRRHGRKAIVDLVVGFIRINENYLMGKFVKGPFPCPSAWEKVIMYDDLSPDIVCGNVGEIGHAFLKFAKHQEYFKVVEQILNVKQPLPEVRIQEMDVAYLVASSLAHKIDNENQAQRAIEYLLKYVNTQMFPIKDLVIMLAKTCLYRGVIFTKPILPADLWKEYLEILRTISQGR